jgi:hypothetical protein
MLVANTAQGISLPASIATGNNATSVKNDLGSTLAARGTENSGVQKSQDADQVSLGKQVDKTNTYESLVKHIEKSSAEDKQTPEQEKAEQKKIQDLKKRDAEVRTHEQAHAAVGGQYAGAPSYEYENGPDGKRYAVGGEVSIDVSTEKDPEDTISKMQIVRAAALAPAEPSAQDLKVAALATQQEQSARAEVAQQAVEGDEPSQSNVSVTAAASINTPSLNTFKAIQEYTFSSAPAAQPFSAEA